MLGFSTKDPCSALRGAWCRPSPSIDKRGSQRFYQSNELAAHDRRGAPGCGHSRSRSSAARAVERSARPRTLSLHAVAARPFHATEPAGEAALAVGLRSARRMVGKGAIAANATLLRGDACGVLAADGPGRILFECRRGYLSTDAECIVSYPAPTNLGRVLINRGALMSAMPLIAARKRTSPEVRVVPEAALSSKAFASVC